MTSFHFTLVSLTVCVLNSPSLAGVAYVVAFTFLMNFFAYLALKYYSGQQPRASVSVVFHTGCHLCVIHH